MIKKKLCWLLLFGSSPSLFFLARRFCVPSFRVCVWCYQLYFFCCWSSFVCWMDRKRERNTTPWRLSHLYNSVFVTQFYPFFFFLSLLLRGGGKRFFSLVGWRASLVNASRRRPSSKGVICGYQLARTVYFIPVQSQTVRNHLIFLFLIFFNDDDTIAL